MEGLLYVVLATCFREMTVLIVRKRAGLVENRQWWMPLGLVESRHLVNVLLFPMALQDDH